MKNNNNNNKTTTTTTTITATTKQQHFFYNWCDFDQTLKVRFLDQKQQCQKQQNHRPRQQQQQYLRYYSDMEKVVKHASVACGQFLRKLRTFFDKHQFFDSFYQSMATSLQYPKLIYFCLEISNVRGKIAI